MSMPNSLKKILGVSIALILLAGPASAKFYALLIGNERYDNPGWSNLKTPHEDVSDLRDVLRNSYGFEVQVLFDVTRGQVIDAIEGYRLRLTQADSLLIYYAGHGQLRGNRGYWVGVDGKASSSADWLETGTLRQLIDSESDGIQARHVLVIADSCYSGVATRSATDPAPSLVKNRAALQQRLYHQQSRIALTSGGTEPVIDSVGGARNSIFATELLRQLRSNAKRRNILEARSLHLSIEGDVFARASEVVGAREAQKPEYGGIAGAGNDGGDFLFIPTGVRAPLMPNPDLDPDPIRPVTRGGETPVIGAGTDPQQSISHTLTELNGRHGLPASTEGCHHQSHEKYGYRYTYCLLRDVLDIEHLSALSGQPLFIDGPHTDEVLILDNPYEFGRYNPKFVKWLHGIAAKAMSSQQFVRATKPIYDKHLSRLATTMWISHEILARQPEHWDQKAAALQRLLRERRSDRYKLANIYVSLANVIFDGTAFKDDEVRVANEFWVRRRIDGTAPGFFRVLDTVWRTYEGDYRAAVANNIVMKSMK